MQRKTKGIYILDKEYFRLIYGEDQRRKINKFLDITDSCYSEMEVRSNPALVSEIEIILSGWGGPLCDETFLSAAPNLKCLFYGSGSIKGIVTDAFWERGIKIVSAWGANAVPVVEYTLAAIFFCLKKAFQHQQLCRLERSWKRLDVPGAYHSTIGIVSLGMIGKMLVEKLRNFDLNILAYDPYYPKERAKKEKINLMPLDDLFIQADVVTLHTPWLQETEKMIKGSHLKAMKYGASLINTSRGAVVDEEELIEVLTSRPDLFAVLDVTHPEPPDQTSQLYNLPNVFLTPHIAGSMGDECLRMGDIMVQQLQRYFEGKSLSYEITQEMISRMA